MHKAAFILRNKETQDRIYPESVFSRITSQVDVVLEAAADEIESLLPDLEPVEILFSGWGPPKLTDHVLDAMPNLKLVLYGAGSLNGIATEDFWKREIPICSAWQANAVPVAEFTLAQIILSLKQIHGLPQKMRDAKGKAKPDFSNGGGAFEANVSLISLGIIGQLVARLLQNLDVNVLAYDPFCDPQKAEALGVTLVSLEEAFSQSRVVSLHTPWLPETEDMITGDLLRSMPPHGTFINTARGAVVNEPEMIRVLQERPDLTALLDVTHPEPPVPESPLFELPNVFLTPHMAGSQAEECGRMGSYMADELERYLNGEPLLYQVSEEMFHRMA
jgi:phosphoglycerate dehydrogenase-like enzyme